MSKKLLDLDGLRYFYGKILARMGNLSNPNLLINGDFQVWQRGTSFNAPSTQIVYTADRWCVNTDASALVTKDTSGGLKVTSNSVGTFTNVIQKLEDDFVSKIIGKKVTLTVEFESGIELINVIGFTDILNTNNIFSNVKNGNKMSVTFTPTVANKNHLYVQMIPNISNQGRSFVVKSVKLELGEIATPLSPRPYGEELALCQRYCVSGSLIGIPYIYSNNHISFVINVPSTFRIVPTLQVGDMNVRDTGGHQSGFTFNGIVNLLNAISVTATKNNHGIIKNADLVSSTAVLDAEIY